MCLCCKITKKILCIIIAVAVIALIGLGILMFFVFNRNGQYVTLTTPVSIITTGTLYEHIHNPAEGQLIKNAATEDRTSDLQRNPYSLSLMFSSDSTLIQSMGKKGNSTVREFTLKTGVTSRYMNLNKAFYGQGVTFVIDPVTKKLLLLQLTLDTKIVIVYDYQSMNAINRLTLDMTAVGITSNLSIEDPSNFNADVQIPLQRLWVTNGSENFYEIKIPDDFSKAVKLDIEKTHRATCVGFLLAGLGDISYNKRSDSLFAAINPHNLVVELDLRDARCRKVITLDALFENEEESNRGEAKIAKDEYFTSIAIKPTETEKAPTLYVTGKIWPQIISVKIKEGGGPTTVVNFLRTKSLPLNL